jgi:FHA domain/B-box zinc finger
MSGRKKRGNQRKSGKKHTHNRKKRTHVQLHSVFAPEPEPTPDVSISTATTAHINHNDTITLPVTTNDVHIDTIEPFSESPGRSAVPQSATEIDAKIDAKIDDKTRMFASRCPACECEYDYSQIADTGTGTDTAVVDGDDANADESVPHCAMETVLQLELLPTDGAQSDIATTTTGTATATATATTTTGTATATATATVIPAFSPILLLCGHTICHECVLNKSTTEQLVSGVDANPTDALYLACPQCRHQSVLIKQHIPIDTDRVAFLSDGQHQQMNVSSRATTCDECDKTDDPAALKWCGECDAVVCGECDQLLHRRALSHHTRVAATALPTHVPTACPDHKLPFIGFCDNEKVLVCQQCMMHEHSGHALKPLEEAAEQAKANLQQTLAVMAEMTRVVRETEQHLNNTWVESQKQLEQSSANIELHFNSLAQKIVERKHQLLDHLKRTHHSNLAQIEKQRRTAAIAMSKLCISRIQAQETLKCDSAISCIADEQVSRANVLELDTLARSMTEDRPDCRSDYPVIFNEVELVGFRLSDAIDVHGYVDVPRPFIEFCQIRDAYAAVRWNILNADRNALYVHEYRVTMWVHSRVSDSENDEKTDLNSDTAGGGGGGGADDDTDSLDHAKQVLYQGPKRTYSGEFDFAPGFRYAFQVQARTHECWSELSAPVIVGVNKAPVIARMPSSQTQQGARRSSRTASDAAAASSIGDSTTQDTMPSTTGSNVKYAAATLKMDQVQALMRAKGRKQSPASTSAPAAIDGSHLIIDWRERSQKFLAKEKLNIGRRSGNDIVISDPLVSGAHAMIENGRLTDRGSTNGTTLNGQVIDSHKAYILQVGDELMFGDTKMFVLSAIDDDDAAADGDYADEKHEIDTDTFVPVIHPPPVTAAMQQDSTNNDDADDDADDADQKIEPEVPGYAEIPFDLSRISWLSISDRQTVRRLFKAPTRRLVAADGKQTLLRTCEEITALLSTVSTQADLEYALTYLHAGMEHVWPRNEHGWARQYLPESARMLMRDVHVLVVMLRCPQMTELSLTLNCTSLRGAFLPLIAQICPKLQLLNLSGASELERVHLQSMKHAELRGLYLHGCTNINDMCVQHVCTHSPRIQELYLVNTSVSTAVKNKLKESIMHVW